MASDTQTANEIASSYSLDAVDAAEKFGIHLDFSHESIEKVEAILDKMHEAMTVEIPNEDTISTFAKMYGFYVGETLRRNLGRGEWIIGSEEPIKDAYCLKIDGAFTLFPAKAYRRLKNGPEDNIATLYQMKFNENSDDKISLKIFGNKL